MKLGDVIKSISYKERQMYLQSSSSAKKDRNHGNSYWHTSD